MFRIKVFDVDSEMYLDSKYGANAPQQFLTNNLPHYSPEIEWDIVPNAKSYAIEFIDYDSMGVTGSIFVHWTACNIHKNKLAANASLIDKDILNGVNSLTNGIYHNKNLSELEKQQININNSLYLGPMPPNSDHTYTFRIFALDIEKLNLLSGYFIGDLHNAMQGHILATSSLNVKYKQFKSH